MTFCSHIRKDVQKSFMSFRFQQKYRQTSVSPYKKAQISMSPYKTTKPVSNRIFNPQGSQEQNMAPQASLDCV